MVYRSGTNANANGGVGYLNANNAASNTNANIGSRLANNRCVKRIACPEYVTCNDVRNGRRSLTINKVEHHDARGGAFGREIEDRKPRRLKANN